MPSPYYLPVHLAPMQGYVDTAYLQARAAVYAPADAAYTPFIRVEKGQPRRQDMDRLRRARELGIDVVPQVIFGSEQEFAILASALRAEGAKRIDLNLGCPYPMQTRQGRGAAMIANADVMSRVARIVADDAQVRYSVKMRLGLTAPGEWRALMPILNSIPMAHVTVHPRVATQMYGGELYLDAFREIADACAHPVVYNGDITSTADIARMASAHPSIAGLMVGRGLLARPSLVDEWRAGQEWTREQRISAVLRMHQTIFDIYTSTLCGETQMLQKLKPFWHYLEPEIGHRPAKAIHKAGSLSKYRQAVAMVTA